jgi:hypothetical protein
VNSGSSAYHCHYRAAASMKALHGQMQVFTKSCTSFSPRWGGSVAGSEQRCGPLVQVIKIEVYSPNGFVKHTLQVPLRQRRTFQIFLSLDIPANGKALLVCNWSGAHLAHALLGLFVIT